MDEFEFFFSFYGLLLSFSVALVVAGLTNVLGLRRRLRLSPLPVLLGIFLLQDMATLWVFAWQTRESLTVNYANIYGGLVIASLYFVAATSAFPLGLDERADLEKHYWENKRLVLGAVMVASGLTLVHAIAVDAIALNSAISWLLQIIYWGPLVALLLTKQKIADVALLSLLVAGYLADPILELI